MRETIPQILTKQRSLPVFSIKGGSPSIAVKLALIITAVIIAGMGLLSLFIIGNQGNILQRQTDAHAAALGDQLSFAAIEPLLAGDTQAIDQLTTNLAENEGIEGVAIFSDQFKKISTLGIIPQQNPDLILQKQPLNWHRGGDKQFDVSSYVSRISLKDLTVGYCVITYNRSFMNAAYRNTIRTVSVITALMVVLGIIVAAFLSKRLSRPIEHVVEGSQEISRGNYRFRFKENRKDELGKLMESLNRMTEGLLRKEQVEQTFSRYVSPNVASALMNDKDKSQLGGSHQEATVLFADISGFTTLSEGLKPAVINSLLNEYFTLIDQIADKHGGHIDKYIGDCAMVLFGVPHQDDKHGLNAVACAVEMQQMMRDYNITRKSRGMITVEFSIGINSGVMLAGNIGSERRMEYTVVGNAVNLASRLSSFAQRGQIIVTKEFHDALGLGSLFETHESGTLELRGKTEPVEIRQIEWQLKRTATPEMNDAQNPSVVH